MDASEVKWLKSPENLRKLLAQAMPDKEALQATPAENSDDRLKVGSHV